MKDLFTKNEKKSKRNGPIATYDGLAVPNTVTNL